MCTGAVEHASARIRELECTEQMKTSTKFDWICDK